MKIRQKIEDKLFLRQLLGLATVVALGVIFIVSLRLIDKCVRTNTVHSPSLVGDSAVVDSLLGHLTDKHEKRTYSRAEPVLPPVELQVFDPNTADSVTLLRLGFAPWQAKSLIRYRAAGAKFYKPDDIKRLYGMTDSMYDVLLPYIQIDTIRFAKPKTARDTLSKDTTKKYVVKIKKDTVLQLNTCDTAELQLLRGVGSYTARRIVAYRKQLGGYYSATQLLEIENIKADSLLCFFMVDTTLIEPINVNKASVERLARHPYLTFSEAKAIYNLRREHIKLNSADILVEKGILTDNQIKRILPYLTFE